MMNYTEGWMGGGMWPWWGLCVLVIILLIFVINKSSKK
jgi:hypothetical protein